MTTPPPSTQLSRLRCARHPDREAAARCASCGLVFCRECVSEHDGRFLCAACLAKAAAAARAAPSRCPRAALLKRALAIAAGAAWLWLCLYLAGLLIEKLPQSFHEGTIWRQEPPSAANATNAPPRHVAPGFRARHRVARAWNVARASSPREFLPPQNQIPETTQPSQKQPVSPPCFRASVIKKPRALAHRSLTGWKPVLLSNPTGRQPVPHSRQAAAKFKSPAEDAP